jgi:hypothetical protein
MPEVLLEASTEVSVEVHTEMAKYMFISHHHDAGQNPNLLIAQSV